MKMILTPPSSTTSEVLFDTEDIEEQDIGLEPPHPSLSRLLVQPPWVNHNSRSPSPEPIRRQGLWEYDDLPSSYRAISSCGSHSSYQLSTLQHPNNDPEVANSPQDQNVTLPTSHYMKVGVCLTLTFLNSSTAAILDWVEVMSGCPTAYEQFRRGPCITEAIIGGVLLMVNWGCQVFVEASLHRVLVANGKQREAIIILFVVLPFSHLVFGICGEVVGWAISKHLASDWPVLDAGRVLFTPLIGSCVSCLLGALVVCINSK
jgi:hypothetical protein